MYLLCPVFHFLQAENNRRSPPQKPLWYVVDVKFVRACREIISLERLKRIPGLGKMWVLKRGMRLSIQPAGKNGWEIITRLPEWGG